MVPFPDTVLVPALTGIQARQLERALSPPFPEPSSVVAGAAKELEIKAVHESGR